MSSRQVQLENKKIWKKLEEVFYSPHLSNKQEESVSVILNHFRHDIRARDNGTKTVEQLNQKESISQIDQTHEKGMIKNGEDIFELERIIGCGAHPAVQREAFDNFIEKVYNKGFNSYLRERYKHPDGDGSYNCKGKLQSHGPFKKFEKILYSRETTQTKFDQIHEILRGLKRKWYEKGRHELMCEDSYHPGRSPMVIAQDCIIEKLSLTPGALSLDQRVAVLPNSKANKSKKIKFGHIAALYSDKYAETECQIGVSVDGRHFFVDTVGIRQITPITNRQQLWLILLNDAIDSASKVELLKSLRKTGLLDIKLPASESADELKECREKSL